MLDALFLLLLVSELLHHSQSFHLHAAEDLVQDLVRQKLNLTSSFDFAFVEVVQLSLALVELIKVSLLEGNACVGLVDPDCKVVLNTLNR
jgi:hypothetical protein